jgi:hypothetical protein
MLRSKERRLYLTRNSQNNLSMPKHIYNRNNISLSPIKHVITEVYLKTS